MQRESSGSLKVDFRYSTSENFATDLCDSQGCGILEINSFGSKNKKTNDQNYLFTKDKGDYLILEDSYGLSSNFYAKEIEKIISKIITPQIVLLIVYDCEEIAKLFLNAGSTHVICLWENQHCTDKACHVFTENFYKFLFSSSNPMSVCDAF